MARYTCPSCGKPYNGRQCRHCLYETFSDEIAHGAHTHKGEPLVVDAPERKPIPRKDPFGCERQTRKAPSGAVTRIVTVILLILVLCVSSFTAISSTLRQRAAELSEPEAAELETLLYTGDGVRVTTDWVPGQAYGGSFQIAVHNETKSDLSFYASQVIVNDYVLNRSNYNCRVRKGHTASSEFVLDAEELAECSIETVQSLSISLRAYDTKSYETQIETEPLRLEIQPIDDFVQPDADQGTLLYEDKAVRFVFREYRPDDYEPEDVTQGELIFYLENKQPQPVSIYLSSANVNGEEADLSLWCDLPGNARCVSRVRLFSLEYRDLKTLEQITDLSVELRYRETGSDGWRSSGFVTLPLP